MRAIRLTDWKTFPSLVEVERPTPGPGEVLLKIAGAGACHSDVAMFHDFEEGTNPLIRKGFTLGHENSGWVEEVGEGVSGFEKGDAYLVYGPIGCKRCRACSRGQDTYCEHPGDVGYMAVGIGRDGGMAEYMTVPATNLIPLGDADPVDAAPLADAALTPYHAIRLSMRQLQRGGSSALVIGLGGLGQIAVQILTAITGATVYATDMKEDAMKTAEEAGAIAVPGGEGQTERIRELTGGRGVDAVFDMVGASPTIALAQQVVAQQGRISVVGIANGAATWSFFTNPYEAELTNTYWGTIEDLYEVVDLYKASKIRPQVERYPMDRALEAYQKLVDGTLSGRAVVMPNS